jgi:hypothetical protein
MDQPINEVFMKFSGKVPFPREMRRGEDTIVVAGGQTYIWNCIKREEPIPFV